jgi:hypothetical protein
MQEVERGLLDFMSKTGSMVEVRRRLDWAKRIEVLSNGHPNAQKTSAAASEAGTLYAKEHHASNGVPLKPQMGLVPIGMNPVTKLWEFYHLRSAWDPRSGAAPEGIEIPRHRSDGSIEVTEA